MAPTFFTLATHKFNIPISFTYLFSFTAAELLLQLLLQLQQASTTIHYHSKFEELLYKETFEKMVEQLEQSGEPYDRNEVFLQAVGGLDKKNRVYGVGSSQGLFYASKIRPCISSSFIVEENELLKEELVQVKDRVKAMEDQIAKLIDSTLRVPHLQSPTDSDVQSATDSEGQDDDDN